MQIVTSDAVNTVPPGTAPNYNKENPLLRLMQAVEHVELSAQREAYLTDALQYLFPFDYLELYGPAGDAFLTLDPREQDNKEDFQKQNLSHFRLTDVQLVRGWASVGSWTGPFLRVSYRGGPDSELSRRAGHQLGPAIRMWIRVGDATTPQLVQMPYNVVSDRYEVELWGDPGFDVRSALDEKGQAAIDRGELLIRADLLRGTAAEFERERLNNVNIHTYAIDHSLHPTRPLAVELAFADEGESVWDSRDGENHRYAFSMDQRGWEQFLGAGVSPNPHGGVGFLEFRNLFSNYFAYADLDDLGRNLQPWNFDAHGNKSADPRREHFLSVDYMDLHILQPTCGIGLHRHRDNQEIFLMLQGRGLMVVGDWCRMPQRERAFEVRTLTAGSLALCRTGQLHGLLNSTDEDAWLFMFGGYD